MTGESFPKMHLLINLLFEKHWGSGHHVDPPPIPHHDDEDARREEGLHGKPHFGEASILVDSLGRDQLVLKVIDPLSFFYPILNMS